MVKVRELSLFIWFRTISKRLPGVYVDLINQNIKSQTKSRKIFLRLPIKLSFPREC